MSLVNDIFNSYVGKDIDSIVKEMKAYDYDGEKTLYTFIKEKYSCESKEDVIDKIKHNHSELFEEVVFNYEMNKPYKYVVLYNIKDGNFEEGIKLLTSSSDSKEDVSLLQKGLGKPKLYNESDHIKLKFNYECKGAYVEINDQGESILNEKKAILPLLIVIHKQDDIVEFRVPRINKIVQNNESNFYQNRMEELVTWFNENTIFNIEQVNTDSVIDLISKDEITDHTGNELKVYSQKMELKSGANAVLDSGNSDDIVLPILGDLKKLIKDNEDIFPPSHKFYDQLIEFISITEEESAYPWISIVWPNSIKSRQIHVKFVFDSLSDSEYNLIDFQRNNTFNKEMMKVAKYISKLCEKNDNDIISGEG